MRRAENPHGITPADGRQLFAPQAHLLERAQLRQPGAHGEIASPQQPLRTQGRHRRIEHSAVDTAARKIGDDVRTIDHSRKRVHVVAAPADVRQDERGARMPGREAREVSAIRDLL